MPDHIVVYNKRVKIPGYPTPMIRQLLQWWGTEVRRANEPDYWVDRMAGGLIEAKRLQLYGLIIDDVRFENEAEFIHEQGGTLIRVNPYNGWECDKATAEHESEVALDSYEGFDLTITPEYGTLDEHADMIINLLKRRA